MRKHYRREDLGEGVRGKHHAAYVRGTNLILLQPEVAAAFPTSAAVNSALKRLLETARTPKAAPRVASNITASKSSGRKTG
jgi:hypothetical protein